MNAKLKEGLYLLLADNILMTLVVLLLSLCRQSRVVILDVIICVCIVMYHAVMNYKHPIINGLFYDLTHTHTHTHSHTHSHTHTHTLNRSTILMHISCTHITSHYIIHLQNGCSLALSLGNTISSCFKPSLSCWLCGG